MAPNSRVVAVALALALGPAVPALAETPAPSFLAGPVERTVYDGAEDDLLTAGLGRAGLAADAPRPADPEAPTPAELRRLAIYANYRALVDMTEGGGYGRLYGPGAGTDGQGLIAGVEYRALADIEGPSGTVGAVTLMVQIPEAFDPAAPCLVAGPSSGSRGVYGAIATVGEWGLGQGCAVAYTDKGAGTGVHDLGRDSVGLMDGRRVAADEAAGRSTFTAPLSDFERERLLALRPHRVAFKHAHSRANPEAAWGESVLASIAFAFHVLGREYAAAEIAPANTVVIASGISNGGGASLHAAERDRAGLIDAVVVSEPNVTPVHDPGFAIVQGDGPAFFAHSRPLFDYTAVLNLYLGCASAHPDLAGAPFNDAASPERCARLAGLGLVGGETTEAQARDAQAKIRAYGFLPEQERLAPSHWTFRVPQAIGATYASAYARAGVEEAVCGYGFAALGGAGQPAPLIASTEAQLFGMSSGIAPTGGIDLVAEDAPEGPVRSNRAPAQNLRGHLCLAALAFGVDPVEGGRLKGRDTALAALIAESVAAIRATGDLGGRPALIVNGRADAVLAPNHTSRAYLGRNGRVEGAASRLSYIEVLNAQHLDALNAFDGFAEAYVPLHHYLVQALDLMLAHLRDGASLPASQVIRTTPRERGEDGLAPVTVEANLPPIAIRPAPGDAIRVSADRVIIPE